MIFRSIFGRSTGKGPRDGGGGRATNRERPNLPAAEVAEAIRKAAEFRPSREFLTAVGLREETPELTFDPDAQDLLREGMRKGCVYCGLAVAELRPRHGRPDPNHFGMELAAAAGHPAALYDRGAEALDRGDREEGLDYFRRAVELGSGAAAKELGVRFQFGYGLPIDEREAFRWYCAAAGEDHPRGTCIAGLCLLAGTGCDRDDRKGERFLQRAAALGDAAARWHLAGHAAKPAARATSWLADLYTVPEAVGHLEMGAKLGHPLCQLWVAQARLAELGRRSRMR